MSQPAFRNASRPAVAPAPVSAPRWRKFLLLTHRQQRTVLLACLLVPAFRVRICLRGYPLSHSEGTTRAPVVESRASAPITLTLAGIRELATAVNIAAAHGPFRGNCLARSATLLWLLHRYRVACVLRVGVRLADGNFAAHAWVESDGQPVNDRADIGQDFLPFAATIPITAFT